MARAGEPTTLCYHVPATLRTATTISGPGTAGSRRDNSRGPDAYEPTVPSSAADARTATHAAAESATGSSDVVSQYECAEHATRRWAASSWPSATRRRAMMATLSVNEQQWRDYIRQVGRKLTRRKKDPCKSNARALGKQSFLESDDGWYTDLRTKLQYYFVRMCFWCQSSSH